jgi:hypothetical protein
MPAEVHMHYEFTLVSEGVGVCLCLCWWCGQLYAPLFMCLGSFCCTLFGSKKLHRVIIREEP